MSLSSRAIAIQGIGYAALVIALQGLTPIEVAAQEITSGGSIGISSKTRFEPFSGIRFESVKSAPRIVETEKFETEFEKVGALEFSDPVFRLIEVLKTAENLDTGVSIEKLVTAAPEQVRTSSESNGVVQFIVDENQAIDISTDGGVVSRQQVNALLIVLMLLIDDV